jgi:hypothetical protein
VLYLLRMGSAGRSAFGLAALAGAILLAAPAAHATVTIGSSLAPAATSGGIGVDDSTPPETIITERPQSKVETRRKKKRVRFEFVSSEQGSVFRCDTDEVLPTACRSPYKSRFPRGKHDFEVVAIDAAGNADPTPAMVEFRVKRKRPRR